MRSIFVDPRSNANQSRVGGLIEDLAGSGCSNNKFKILFFIVINKHNPLFTTMKTINFEFVITASDQAKGRAIFDDRINQSGAQPEEN